MTKTLLTAIACLFMIHAQAQTITTATKSGSYTDPTVWDNGLPGVNLSTGTIAVIPNGITVTASNDIQVTALNSEIQVEGTLSMSNNKLEIVYGGIGGKGTIDADSFIYGTLATPGSYFFEGTVNGNHVELLTQIEMANNATINVASSLTIYGKFQITTGTVTVGNGAEIIIYGDAPGIKTDALTASQLVGGILKLPTSYSVKYLNGNVISSQEIGSSATLTNLTVDVGAGNTATLGGNVSISGTANLTSGLLDISARTFELADGTVNIGNGSFASTSASTVDIKYTSGPTTLSLPFAAGKNTVMDMNVEFADPQSKLDLVSDIKISGELNLTTGMIYLNNYNLQFVAGGAVPISSSVSYIVSNQSGEVKMDISGNASKLCPLGTETDFLPIVLTGKNNTAHNGLGLSVKEGVKTLGTTGTNMAATQPMVNATWFIDKGNSGKIDLDVELLWAAQVEQNNFDNSKCFIAQFNGFSWDKQPVGAATSQNGYNGRSREGVTSEGGFAVFGEGAVSVEYLSKNNATSIYPNPASNNINIAYKGSEQVRATLFNLTGKMITSVDLQKGVNSINISQLTNGIYFIKLDGASVHTTHKFVKQ